MSCVKIDGGIVQLVILPISQADPHSRPGWFENWPDLGRMAMRLLAVGWVRWAQVGMASTFACNHQLWALSGIPLR